MTLFILELKGYFKKYIEVSLLFNELAGMRVGHS